MMPTPSGSVIVGEKIDSLEDVKTNQTYIVNPVEGIKFGTTGNIFFLKWPDRPRNSPLISSAIQP